MKQKIENGNNTEELNTQSEVISEKDPESAESKGKQGINIKGKAGRPVYADANVSLTDGINTVLDKHGTISTDLIAKILKVDEDEVVKVLRANGATANPLYVPRGPKENPERCWGPYSESEPAAINFYVKLVFGLLMYIEGVHGAMYGEINGLDDVRGAGLKRLEELFPLGSDNERHCAHKSPWTENLADLIENLFGNKFSTINIDLEEEGSMKSVPSDDQGESNGEFLLGMFAAMNNWKEQKKENKKEESNGH